MDVTDLRTRAAALADDPLWRWVVPVALTTFTAILYLARLDEPARIIFDETYYVNDARQYLDAWVEDSFAVHPPVGKWMIALGIAVLGDNPVGWRATGALAGAGSVLVTYLLGLRLFRHVGVAALAALLLALDGLFFVQARTSMLDIFLALFIVLGAYFTVRDHDATGAASLPLDEDDRPFGEADPAPRPLPRRAHPFRMLAGLAFGLAIATKWSGLFALGAAGVLVLRWELARRKATTGRLFTDLRPLVASLAVAFVLIPSGVYLASYLPWLANYEYSHEGRKECDENGEIQDPCDVGAVGRLRGLYRYQKSIWTFHDDLEASHPYRAPASTWPVMGRPVVYYWETCSEDRANGIARTDDETGEVTPAEPCVVEREEAAEIIAVGNPALWYGFLAASALLVAGHVRRDRAATTILAFYAMQFVPWLVVSRPVFFFYMVPVVPFLALGLAYGVRALMLPRSHVSTITAAGVGGAVGFGLALLLSRAAGAETRTWWWLGLGLGWIAGSVVGARWDRRHDGTHARRWAGATPGAWAGTAVALVAFGLFLYFLPVWAGIPMEDELIRQRWWFDSWI